MSLSGRQIHAQNFPDLSARANPHSDSHVRFNVRRTHPRLKIALIAAFPLEAINFWVVGYPAATHPIFRFAQNPAVALQWYVLHLPGIIASDRSIYLRRHATLDSIVLFILGYIGTVILLLAIFWFGRILSRAVHRMSSPVSRAA
jgi:hypothetical protein